jgi:hypothetical protein
MTLKIELLTKLGKSTIGNIKDIVIYPDGDKNTGAFICVEHSLLTKIDRKTYTSTYTKPISIVITEENI